ncbi:MAG: alpha/beta hydrolase [Xanthomonadaceae bacterium]|nr:alpha/beta hydrolase [Xanthomonadaceae bacterium]
MPLYQRGPQGTPRAVVLALHGFGDHAGSFQPLAASFVRAGIALYAYDQRGFGATVGAGHWAGHASMVKDARTLARLLRQRYPDSPFYLIGKSMGGAVALLAMTEQPSPPVDGVALIAPAVWARKTMPWYQRQGLRLLARIAPGLALGNSAAHRLGIRPTDDPEVTRALRQDPLVLKRYRMDTLDGLARLMDAALQAAPRLPGPALLLYGEQDLVIPPEPVCELLARLPDPAQGIWRMALYPRGYHMLTRYTGAAQTHQDLVAWVLDPDATLPSGQEVDRDRARQRLCPSAIP